MGKNIRKCKAFGDKGIRKANAKKYKVLGKKLEKRKFGKNSKKRLNKSQNQTSSLSSIECI